jgi:hypothetical protein
MNEIIQKFGNGKLTSQGYPIFDSMDKMRAACKAQKEKEGLPSNDEVLMVCIECNSRNCGI